MNLMFTLYQMLLIDLQFKYSSKNSSLGMTDFFCYVVTVSYIVSDICYILRH